MVSADPLATASDVEDLWRPLTAADQPRINNLIRKASQRLRQKCPFDIDARVALFTTDPTQPTALDPAVVADVVATIVKRFLVNPDGVASESDGAGPFSHSATYVNRYDKSGQDVRGALQIVDSDIDQLRPAVPSAVPSTIRVDVPGPQVVIPPRYGRPGFGGLGVVQPIVAPDIAPGTGVE